MAGSELTLSRCNQVRVDFVLAELDLAITFCQVGLTTSDLVHAERNVENARTALKTILQIRDQVQLTQHQKKAIATKTSKLASFLVKLERRLTSSGVWMERAG